MHAGVDIECAEEKNALRYAAGYIPRALKSKIEYSGHSSKESLALCLLDLIEDDGMGDDDEESRTG